MVYYFLNFHTQKIKIYFSPLIYLSQAYFDRFENHLGYIRLFLGRFYQFLTHLAALRPISAISTNFRPFFSIFDPRQKSIKMG
jgi:hypothetical protein